MRENDVDWNNLRIDILNNFQTYHQQFIDNNGFDGPSLHFHERALNCENNQKAEMVYAVVTSWGMHRMGDRGAKMNDFPLFRDSINTQFLEACDRAMNNCLDIIRNRRAADLVPLFKQINIMQTNTKIVGNSKALAHFIPQLVCPIDREYTCRFVKGSRNIPKNEADLFEWFHNRVIFPLIEDSQFSAIANMWIQDSEMRWDTSLPKIVDNIIIGKMRGNQ